MSEQTVLRTNLLTIWPIIWLTLTDWLLTYAELWWWWWERTQRPLPFPGEFPCTWDTSRHTTQAALLHVEYPWTLGSIYSRCIETRRDSVLPYVWHNGWNASSLQRSRHFHQCNAITCCLHRSVKKSNSLKVRHFYRRIFVDTFCLINLCLSLSDDANKIKTLKVWAQYTEWFRRNSLLKTRNFT